MDENVAYLGATAPEQTEPEKPHDLDFVLQLSSLSEEFMDEWEQGDYLNQPTLLDFMAWVSELAIKLTGGVDDEPPLAQ